MQRVMGFISIACLLIMSVSCSQPTAPKEAGETGRLASLTPAGAQPTAPKEAGETEIALLRQFLNATKDLKDLKAAEALELLELGREGNLFLPLNVTPKKTGDREVLFTLKGVVAKGITGGLSGTLSVSNIGRDAEFTSMDLTGNGKRLVIDRLKKGAKSIVFSIDGVKYQHTSPV